MHLEVFINVNVPADKAWELMAHEFNKIHEWSAGISHSSGSRNACTTGAARVCDTALGQFDEKIIRFDEAAKSFAYHATNKDMPFFVKSMVIDNKVNPISATSCRAGWVVDVDIIAPFNIFPGVLLKMQLTQGLKASLEEMKYYLERGQKHPRKVKALDKAQKSTMPVKAVVVSMIALGALGAAGMAVYNSRRANSDQSTLPATHQPLQSPLENGMVTTLVSTQSSEILSFTGAGTGNDPVPEAIAALQGYPALTSAITEVVFANNIPGHDAEQIDLEMKTDLSTANITFFFSEGFVHPTYGSQPQARIVTCSIASQDGWNCNEA
ncbi:MAG: SRPBCC family protein [Cyanobacteria bacterium P01_E01_bin.6]